MEKAALLAVIIGCSVTCSPREPDRVQEARRVKGSVVRDLLRSAGLSYPPAELYLRAFKQERQLEIWANDRAGAPMRKVATYPIAKLSGKLGPKRREGDRQVPEGFYLIDRYNPRSAYHLSLGLDYPNPVDQARNPSDPGSDIFIHGNQVSIGCLAMTDDKIREIYLMALDARAKPVRVDVWPMMPTNPAFRLELRKADKDTADLWTTLAAAFESFEATKRPRPVERTRRGYRLG